jgi:acyl-coenzyme A thioesterase PaaI-like protein
MSRNHMPKKERHEKLVEKLASDPFLTDEELADLFNVSVPTIRLDRLELGIPELRERVRNVADQNFAKVRTLGIKDIVGELVDIKLNESGISILETNKGMLFENTNVVRGQFIYAFAESLAIAVIDADAALVVVANIKYSTPVKSNSRLIAKAEVKRKMDKNFIVWVKIFHNNKMVFRSKFILVALHGENRQGVMGVNEQE